MAEKGEHLEQEQRRKWRLERTISVGDLVAIAAALAADGMLASKWAMQVGKRALHLAKMMREG